MNTKISLLAIAMIALTVVTIAPAPASAIACPPYENGQLRDPEEEARCLTRLRCEGDGAFVCDRANWATDLAFDQLP